MSIPREVQELEQRSLGSGGEPTLGLAYEQLLSAWRDGSRSREVCLHLMFLAWYLLCEPAHLTGWDNERVPHESLPKVFREVHEYLKPSIAEDAEALFVIGLMAHLFPYLLGDIDVHETLAHEYRKLYRALAPNGIPRDVFSGRGAYGDYFTSQSQVEGGY